MHFRFPLQSADLDLSPPSHDRGRKILLEEPLPYSPCARIKIVGSPRQEPVSNT